MRVIGTGGMSQDELIRDIERGGRFVQFTWAYSLLVVTVRQPSDIYFIPAGEGSLAKHFKYSLATAIFGWWGIPWGPVYTLRALWSNLSGGILIPHESIDSLLSAAPSIDSDPDLRAALATAKNIAKIHKRILMGFWLAVLTFVPIIGQLLIPAFAIYQAWASWQAATLLGTRYRTLACLLCAIPVANLISLSLLANRLRSKMKVLGIDVPFAGVDPADLDDMAIGAHPAAGLTSH